MGMQLLERDHLLNELAHLLDEAAHGTGRSVLVTGEAGIGKSALIERFAELHSASARFCWGRCEALFTPRPLGPLHDIAQQLQGHTGALLEQEANRTTIFSTFLEALSDGSLPTVAVIEDAHWADEATLDLLKFLGRRVQQASILLIITYRDDEIGPSHPLRFVLGDLPSRSTKRLRLTPLSQEAVAALAHDAHHASHPDLTNLYTITGGNPFFVTEVLASDDSANVPDTVRDAVLARAARLSPQGHAVLELASIVPARAELWLFQTLLPQSSSTIEECIQAGVLRPEPEAVAFRHELARLAIESTLQPHRQKALHAEVLHALSERGEEEVPLARLVHHAALADDSSAVLRFAPEAAKQAAQQGAHREAASHYATVLRYADALAPALKATMLENRAYECYLTSQLEAGIQARSAALALWRKAEAGERIGCNLRWLSRLNWFLGENAAAEAYASEAIAVLEALPSGSELAMAYSNLAQLRMLEGRNAEAVDWGMRALKLAEELGDDEVIVHTLNNIGTAQVQDGAEEGYTRLETSLRLALKHGFEEHAARAFTNLGSCAVTLRQYARASQYLDEGILYCTERDLDSWRLYMGGWRARTYLEVGDWTAATQSAAEVLTDFRVSPVTRISALVVLASVRLRRGDPGSQPLLDEVREIALKTGESQRIIPVAIARAEAAWLHGDLATCQTEALVGYQIALEHANGWDRGQSYYWLWKAGHPSNLPDELPEPYTLLFAGDWQLAADAWERLGCPYEQALALGEGTVETQRTALTLLERLGARATTERLKQEWGTSHQLSIPRGPRPSTRNNPAGLTNQQLEVLALMADGLHNAEIAEALHVSLKTVEHHVSAVLAKLNARSRVQAVAQARNMGVVTKMGGQGQPI